MKLATYERGGAARLGAVDAAAKRLIDLADAAAAAGHDGQAFASMLALIDAGPQALDEARALMVRYGGEEDIGTDLIGAKLLAPLPLPRQIRDFSCFPVHVTQAPAGMHKLRARLAGEPAPDVPPAGVPEVYRGQPVYYISNRFSVAGPDVTVRWPRYSKYMDYELELGMVIGKTGKDISAKAAGDHIFGYTVYNDFSARDAQLVEMQGRLGPAKGKSFDMGNAIGPWIVTADEIDDPYALEMSVSVNAQERASGTSSGMLHSFEEIIAFVSRDETIHAGELFGSGTMGNGCGLEHDRYLEHGDLVELTIGKIGTLRNRVEQQDN